MHLAPETSRPPPDTADSGFTPPSANGNNILTVELIAKLLAYRPLVMESLRMRITRFVRTMLLVLAVALAGNGFASAMMMPATAQQQSMASVAALPTQTGPMQMGMTNMSNCCFGSQICATGNGPVGACGVGMALFPETGRILSGPSVWNHAAPEAAVLAAPQTLMRLFRPPRA